MVTWFLAQQVPIHPITEPARDIMVPMEENMVMARNKPSIRLIRSHVSTGEKIDKLKTIMYEIGILKQKYSS